MNKFVVFISKNKAESKELFSLISSIVVYSDRKESRRIDTLCGTKYRFFDIESDNESSFLRGLAIDVLYFNMNLDDVPEKCMDTAYPYMCRSDCKIIHSEKFDLSLFI